MQRQQAAEKEQAERQRREAEEAEKARVEAGAEDTVPPLLTQRRSKIEGLDDQYTVSHEFDEEQVGA